MSMTPLTGDPHAVIADAADMADAAEKMREAALGLYRLMNQTEYRSDAIDALKSNAIELAQVVTDAYTRYEGTAEALADYGPALADAQQRALEAIHSLHSTDVGAAQHKVHDLELKLLNPLLSSDERHHDEVLLAHARSHLDYEKSVAHGAQAAYEQAVADRDAAADRAIGRIHDAIVASHLNDTFGDKLENWKDKYLEPFLEAVVKVLETVNKWLSAIALVLAFIPGLQEIAAALYALSKVLSVVVLAAKVIQYLIGDASLSEVVGAAITTALFFVGGKLAKGALSKLMPVKAMATAGKGEPILISEMGFKDSSRYLLLRLKDSSIDYEAGVKKLGQYLAKEGTDIGYDYAKAYDLKPVEFILDPKRYTLDYAKQHHLDLVEVALDPKGYVTDKTTNFLDSVVSPQLPRLDSIGTIDVHPLHADFSKISAHDIVSHSFPSGHVQDQPLTCTAASTSSAGVATGGGSGW